jgi:hypothetical protein
MTQADRVGLCASRDDLATEDERLSVRGLGDHSGDGEESSDEFHGSIGRDDVRGLGGKLQSEDDSRDHRADSDSQLSEAEMTDHPVQVTYCTLHRISTGSQAVGR